MCVMQIHAFLQSWEGKEGKLLLKVTLSFILKYTLQLVLSEFTSL